MRVLGKIAVLVAAALLVLTSASARPLEDGLAAYLKGDYAIAVRLLLPFAEQGDAVAQTNLGFIYAEGGKGVPQDYVEAMSWYGRAAEQDNASAQTALGFLYTLGKGVPQDYVAAHMWFNLAAAKGDTDAAKGRDGLVRHMTRE